MAMGMKDFLIAYYKQLHFDKMPLEVRARFDGYVAAKDFKGNMKNWVAELMLESPPNSGKYVNKALPDPNDPNNGLVQEDWEKLFKVFNTTLARMDQDSDGKAENKQARDFLTEYYGNGKLFSLEPVDGATESAISVLRNNMGHLKGAIQNFLPEDVSFEQFEKDLKASKYNTNGKFRKLLINLVDKLENAKQWGIQGASQEVINALNLIDTEKIAAGFDQKPNPGKLSSFKQEYKFLLNRLHDKDKLREFFGKHDEGKITSPLAKALKKVDYDDKNSKSYVHPKSTDELTPWQQLQKWTSDTYENYLEKYVKLRGDRMFFSMPAQLICKGIDKAKIKPTDGIDAVLKNVDTIKKSMQYKSQTALDHFDWFIKEMGVLKDAMPKAFEGGLRNGPQLRRLVEKMIVDAVETGKVNEAKTAMEVLSVIKYANTTSKIMDTIKGDKELFTLFSNKDLSWNTNEAVQLVTKALDKSVRAAFLGVGYGVTIGVNLVRKSRSKIRKKKGLLAKAQQEWAEDVENQKQDVQRALNSANVRKTQNWNAVHNARRKGDIEADINNFTGGAQMLQNTIENGLQQLASFVQQQTNNQATQDRDILVIQKYIEDVKNAIQGQGTTGQNPTVPQLTGVGQGMQNVINTIDNTLTNLSNQNQQLGTKQTELDNLNNAIAELRAANNQKTEMDKKLKTWGADHKDKYKELIDHWNKLETGRDTHTGEMYSWLPRSAEKKQKDFWNKMGGRGI